MKNTIESVVAKKQMQEKSIPYNIYRSLYFTILLFLINENTAYINTKLGAIIIEVKNKKYIKMQ